MQQYESVSLDREEMCDNTFVTDKDEHGTGKRQETSSITSSIRIVFHSAPSGISFGVRACVFEFWIFINIVRYL